jgi:hypothetical protein
MACSAWFLPVLLVGVSAANLEPPISWWWGDKRELRSWENALPGLVVLATLFLFAKG